MFKKILVISKWEIKRSKFKFNKRMILVFVFLILAIFFLFFSMINTETNVVLNIYRVGFVGNDPILKSALAHEGRFNLIESDQSEELYNRGNLDLLIVSKNGGTVVYYPNREKSDGALDALDIAIKRYKAEQLPNVEMDDVAAAYPVWIETHYLKKTQNFEYFRMGNGEETLDIENPQITPPGKNPSMLEDDVLTKVSEEIADPMGFSDEFGISYEGREITLPYLFTSPMPFNSVLLAFLFAIPIYIFSQLYSSSFVDEKTLNRAELLLSSPISRWDIILGKTLIYFIVALVSSALISIVVLKEFNLMIVTLLIPIILFFLSISFFSAVISRSFKENSFIILFLSVIFFAYLFFPAMFTNVHVASNISPITFIVRNLEGEAIDTSQYVFATFPLLLSSFLIMFFGGLMFNAEDLFSHRNFSKKFFNAVYSFRNIVNNNYLAVFLLSASLIPIAFLVELVLIVMLFQAPFPYSVILVILLSALVEEVIKSVGIVALLSRERSLVTVKNLVLFSIISGIGFFLGEKILAFIIISQITNSYFGIALAMGGVLVAALLAHIVGVMISSIGILWSRGKMGYRFYFFLLLAVLAHSFYNLRIIGGII